MISDAGLSGVVNAADIIGQYAKPSVVVEDIHTVGASVPKEMGASMLAAQGLSTTAAGALASNILGQFSGTPTAMNEKGSASGSQLASGLRGEVNTVKIALSKIHALFSSELRDVGNIMNQEGTIAGQRFGSAITTTTNSNIMPAIRGIVSGVRAALSALPGIMSNLGSLAGQGMYNGLASWEGAITSAAARIANSVNASTRRALQVRSPSRVMEETYAYVGEGGAIGLEKSGQQILDVAADIVQGMTDTFRDADIGMEIIGQDDSIYSMAADPYTPGDLRHPADNAAANAEIGYLMQIIAQLDVIANSQWVTDTGVLVGVMAPKMNEAFAAISRKEKRR